MKGRRQPQDALAGRSCGARAGAIAMAAMTMAWVIALSLGCDRHHARASLSNNEARVSQSASPPTGPTAPDASEGGSDVPWGGDGGRLASGAEAGDAPETRDAPYLEAAPVRGKSIGHTSVVFKLQLEGGFDAAWKPRSKKGGQRYRGEVAAFRLSRALGLDNVPPAYPRAFPASRIESALGTGSPSLALFQEEAIVDSDRSVRGAILPWIAHFEILPVETPPWKAKLATLLGKDAKREGDDQDLAPQLSTMIVFDYVIGNWDRWSGGNVAIDREARRVLFVDNDGGFYVPAPEGLLAVPLAHLRETFRFSRGFVERLRALDPENLLQALGEESPGEPLLSKEAVAGCDDRRKRALALIAKKVAALSEAAVLAFP